MSRLTEEVVKAWDALWINARLATMNGQDHDYGVMEGAALAVKDGRITWIGNSDNITGLPGIDGMKMYDVANQWITPGMIDCHTHLVYGGNRSREFELRLQGASYEELQRAGGGILSTVRATRDISPEALLRASWKRLEVLKREGVTTVEIKSGYGLDLNTEIKILEIARRIGEEDPQVDVVTTFLGAHALPPEYQDDRDGYVNLVVETLLPAVAERGLADAVDGFCETIAFTRDEMERVFNKARELKLPIKLHAEQLSDSGGALLAAEYGALSADHLEYLSEPGVKALSDAGTVAVLLPGAFYTLRETQLPPLQLFREHNVPMAIATDSNPGSSPVLSILLMLNMACTLFCMTPAEALAGVTRNAARALGLGKDRGTLEVGKKADFVVWDIDHPSELAYMAGANPCSSIVKSGVQRILP